MIKGNNLAGVIMYLRPESYGEVYVDENSMLCIPMNDSKIKQEDIEFIEDMLGCENTWFCDGVLKIDARKTKTN